MKHIICPQVTHSFAPRVHAYSMCTCLHWLPDININISIHDLALQPNFGHTHARTCVHYSLTSLICGISPFWRFASPHSWRWFNSWCRGVGVRGIEWGITNRLTKCTSLDWLKHWLREREGGEGGRDWKMHYTSYTCIPLNPFPTPNPNYFIIIPHWYMTWWWFLLLQITNSCHVPWCHKSWTLNSSTVWEC